MRIRITFEPNTFVGYSFEVEGETWEDIFKAVDEQSEKFDKGHQAHFGKRTALDRLLGR